MMIDFEDREPAPPLSRGERVLLVLVAAFTIYGFVSQAATIWSWIASLIS